MLQQFGRLAIANILSNLMVPLAGIIDTAFLGHLADIRYLAGVAIANVIFNVVYWSFGFLRMGTTGLIAQAFGRADEQDVKLILLRHGLAAVGFGLLIVLLQVPIRQIGFGLMSVEAGVELSGQAFYTARIWGSPAVLLNFVLLGWFLGCGRGKQVVVLSMVANGSNVLLDYWFIQQLGWASAGAGAATTLSQVLMLAVGLGYLFRQFSLGAFWQLRTQVWERLAIAHMFQLNRDILIRTFAIVLSFALFTNWSAALGTDILAANTLLLQVVTLNAYFVDGIAFATESYAGQFLGAGDHTRLKFLLNWGMGLSLLLGATFALVFIVFSQPLFQLMTRHEAVIRQVENFVWWLLPTLSFGAIAFQLDGYFLGLTAGSALRNSTLSAALLGFLPLGCLAIWQQQPHLLWLAMASFMAIRAMTLLWRVPQTLTVGPAPAGKL